MRNRLQVRRIAATRVAAQMVELSVLGNWADEHLVHHAVRESLTPIQHRRTVSESVVFRRVDPTFVDSASVQFNKARQEWLTRHVWEYNT